MPKSAAAAGMQRVARCRRRGRRQQQREPRRECTTAPERCRASGSRRIPRRSNAHLWAALLLLLLVLPAENGVLRLHGLRKAKERGAVDRAMGIRSWPRGSRKSRVMPRQRAKRAVLAAPHCASPALPSSVHQGESCLLLEPSNGVRVLVLDVLGLVRDAHAAHCV